MTKTKILVYLLNFPILHFTKLKDVLRWKKCRECSIRLIWFWKPVFFSSPSSSSSSFLSCSQPSTTVPHSGPTRTSLTARVARLGLTHKRPSYRVTGTHPSPRSVLVWRSANRSTSLSSTNRPTLCTHWSLTANTVAPHWVVTRGRRWFGSEASLQVNCNKEGFNVESFYSYRSKAKIGLLGNNEKDCESADSRIGFGTGGTPDDKNSCGNQKIRAMGYTLVH